MDNQGDTIAYKNIQIEKGSQATPYEPYSNICEITGYTELNLTRCGVNLWDEEWELGDISSSNGQNTSSTTQIRTKNYISVVPGVQYYSKVGNIGTTPNLKMRYYDKNKNFIDSDPVSYPNQVMATIPNDCYYIRIVFPTSYGTTYNNDISINYPSTDTTYHPYNGQTYTIAFGQTVYGGVYDANAGKVRITHGFSPLSSSWFWAKSNSYAGSFYAEVTNVGAKANTPFICTHARTVTSLSDYVNGCCYCDGSINIRIMTADTTVQQWKDYIDAQAQANTPICICYELATPIEIDVSELSVDTIVGVNNIVSDCGGDMSIEYYTGPAKDIKDFIGDGVEVGDLANVEITTPTNNQVLKYDSTANKWVNGEGGGSSGDHITLTQAEYDALVQAGTVDPNAFYFIEDGSPSAFYEKVLYTNIDESTWVSQGAGDTITLSDDITQFDEVRFEGAFFETNNNTGYKLTHFCSATVPKATLVDCLNKYGDSNTNPLQWQGMFDVNFIYIQSNNSPFSASFALKIPTSTSIFVKLKSIVGWTASQWGITKIVGINYDVVGGETHQYSTEEQVVGKWIDGSTLYERTLVLRDNGVDKYTFTGNMDVGGFYAVGLTGIDKIWIDGLCSKRGKSGDTDYIDIDNNSTEVVTIFKHTDGSFYFKDTHAPVDIILIIRYTKSSS